MRRLYIRKFKIVVNQAGSTGTQEARYSSLENHAENVMKGIQKG